MDATERGQMATFPIGANYVMARAALLDVLEALGTLRSAAVLVGAQAVYEYTRNVDQEFTVSPFTLDADLAFLPELLADAPKLSDAMESAGFELSSQPGIYRRNDGTQVDLLVPEIVSGRQGRRGADLGVHGIRAARQVRGLEGALVSQTTKPIAALADGDERAFDILARSLRLCWWSRCTKSLTGPRCQATPDCRTRTPLTFIDFFAVLKGLS